MTTTDSRAETDRSVGAVVHHRRWVVVCPLDRLIADRGVAALIDDRAVAVFLLTGGEIVAIDNVDPCSGASVMSRGIVGDADGTPIVASPMYKDRFDLRSGRCLDRSDVTLAVHEAREVAGSIMVRLASRC